MKSTIFEGAVFGLAGVNNQTGTTYTFVPSDKGKLVTMSNAAANTATIDTDANQAIPNNSQIQVEMKGAGITSIAAAGGVSLTIFGNVATLLGTGAQVLLTKVAANTWIAQGAFGPGPLNGTTLALTNAAAAYNSGAQLSIDYDATHRGRLWTDSNGRANWDSPEAAWWNFSYGGAPLWGFSNAVFGVGAGGTANHKYVVSALGSATIVRYDVTNDANTGIGDNGDTSGATLAFLVKTSAKATLTATLLTLASGVGIKATLPTSDPHVAGVFWANLGIVTQSAG